MLYLKGRSEPVIGSEERVACGQIVHVLLVVSYLVLDVVVPRLDVEGKVETRGFARLSVFGFCLFSFAMCSDADTGHRRSFSCLCFSERLEHTLVYRCAESRRAEFISF